MRLISLIVGCMLLTLSLSAQQQQQYSRAKVYLDDTHTILRLSALGIATDHGEHKKNTFFISDLSERDIAVAKAAGFSIDILISDVSKHYKEQNKATAAKTTAGAGCNPSPDIAVPSHFHLGTYAGYFTYDEMLDILDSMQLLYPGLISMKQPIGTYQTIEGRPIYWVRVSNHPATEDPAKPQMLYTSVHHAREPGSLSSNIFYLWYLLEHYATDPQIKAIMDNTELYFVPCINPDGYIRNITTDPTGGGMWRKNLRDNLDGTFGVDLNRNYGYFWGYDDIGSSPDGSTDTYRGAAGFSEPETQAIKWFAEQHDFKLNLNYHTFNNDLIYPWGYIASLLTPDSAQFFSYGSFITQHNHYRYGTCDQTLSYISNGGSDDWMYGETTTKNKVFAFTPEIGANEFGFYPPAANIIPDCQNNLLANVNTAALLLAYAEVKSTEEKILVAPAGYLHYDIERLGMRDGATYTVSITSLDSRLIVPATPHTYSSLSLLQQVSDSFSYTLSAGTPNGELIRYVLKVNNGIYDSYDTVSFYYGKYYTITTPSTSSLTDWTTSDWNVCTTAYHSAPSSIKSSVVCGNNYINNDNAIITLTDPVDLTGKSQAWLRFYARWGIESTYDYAIVEAFDNVSSTWQPLCGKHTKEGSNYQLHYQPIYDGQQPYWVQEQMDLGAYLGQTLQLRLRMKSDPANNYEGFYFDDMEVRTIKDTTVTAVTELKDAELSLFPNPASKELTITTPASILAKPLNAAIYDCLGREVMNFIISKPATTIGISTLPEQVYYLKASEGGRTLPVQKLVVNR